jgi:hypothetical protein
MKLVYINELYIFGVHTYNKFARWYSVSAHLLNPVKNKNTNHIFIQTFYILYFHITCRASHAQIVHKGGVGGDVTICP